MLLAGVWRAIGYAEFGRAVAEERARVAREIHDGLAQYLFAVSTHARMLENGADPSETIAAAARRPRTPPSRRRASRCSRCRRQRQRAVRRGAAPLRRVPHRRRALEVELEIDADVRLAPDEQIEVFRIVQEGLANVRKHANATRAEVVIGMRDCERFVLGARQR